jgi:hypothetical protein
MTTATRDSVRLDRVDKGEWLNRLLDDVQTEIAFQPSVSAVARMRAQIVERMAAPTEVAA